MIECCRFGVQQNVRNHAFQQGGRLTVDHDRIKDDPTLEFGLETIH
jgi:hypothetical protein